MRTVSRVYDNYADAVAVVTDLEAAADLAPNCQISMIANENAHGRDTALDTTRTKPTSEAGPGAGVGAIVGGGVGLLTGLGLLAIPGVGPLVAAGWLATTLAGAATGAAAGGIVGALVKSGSLMKRPKCTRGGAPRRHVGERAGRGGGCAEGRSDSRSPINGGLAYPSRPIYHERLATIPSHVVNYSKGLFRFPQMGPQGPILLTCTVAPLHVYVSSVLRY